MKARVRATRPDEVEYTIEMTATLSRWKALKESIEGHTGVATKFRDLIFSCIQHAEEHGGRELGDE